MEKYPIGRTMLSCCCERTAPTAYPHASVSRMNLRSKFGSIRNGRVVRIVRSCCNDVSVASVHSSAAFLLCFGSVVESSV